MVRLVFSICLLSLFPYLVGCQMCCTPYDYRLSGYVNRFDDYRGFSPVYRAGSILSGDGYDVCRIGNAYHVGGVGDFYNNAGNFGTTTPVTLRRYDPNAFEYQPGVGPNAVAIPRQAPAGETWLEPRRPANGGALNIDDLPRTEPRPMPVLPPARPVVPPAWDDSPIESVPFSPNDEAITPPNTVPPTDMDLPVTLEELRRLDPSVQDVQIISIEDAAVDTLIR